MSTFTCKVLKSFVSFVSQDGSVIFVLLTGPNQLGLVCGSEGHRKLASDSQKDTFKQVHGELFTAVGR